MTDRVTDQQLDEWLEVAADARRKWHTTGAQAIEGAVAEVRAQRAPLEQALSFLDDDDAWDLTPGPTRNAARRCVRAALGLPTRPALVDGEDQQ